jgi:hypothetical protein
MFWRENNRCNYCLEFYKKGVVSNVKSYINRLEKDDAVNNDLLSHETSNEENYDDNNDDYEVNENNEISLIFRNALESINTW